MKTKEPGQLTNWTVRFRMADLYVMYVHLKQQSNEAVVGIVTVRFLTNSKRTGVKIPGSKG